MVTISKALASATKRLLAYLKNPVNAQQEAAWLFAHILNCSVADLHARGNKHVAPTDLDQFEQFLIQRVEQHKPLAYILGTAQFGELVYNIKPPVLIPRPETEQMTLWLIEQIQSQTPDTPLKILDLCTGSGCIALHLAYSLPKSTVIGVDICDEALALAEENKAMCEITNVTFLKSNLFEAVRDQKFDIIVSNPPYLSEQEWSELSEDVKHWEAPHALKTDNDGLAIYQQIATEAPALLSGQHRTLPALVLEIGHAQKKSVQQLLHRFNNVTCHEDLYGLERWMSALL